jgi:hypothetical protein
VSKKYDSLGTYFFHSNLQHGNFLL